METRKYTKEQIIEAIKSLRNQIADFKKFRAEMENKYKYFDILLDKGFGTINEVDGFSDCCHEADNMIEELTREFTYEELDDDEICAQIQG